MDALEAVVSTRS